MKAHGLRPLVVDHIDADLKDGVLTVTIPKTEESKPKKIPLRQRVKQALSS